MGARMRLEGAGAKVATAARAKGTLSVHETPWDNVITHRWPAMNGRPSVSLVTVDPHLLVSFAQGVLTLHPPVAGGEAKNANVTLHVGEEIRAAIPHINDPKSSRVSNIVSPAFNAYGSIASGDRLDLAHQLAKSINDGGAFKLTVSPLNNGGATLSIEANPEPRKFEALMKRALSEHARDDRADQARKAQDKMNKGIADAYAPIAPVVNAALAPYTPFVKQAVDVAQGYRAWVHFMTGSPFAP